MLARGNWAIGLKEDTETDPAMALMAYLRNADLEPDERFRQEGPKRLIQTVMELEAAEQSSAGRNERRPERRTYRNGHQVRVWETRVREISLRIPHVRDGFHLPSLLIRPWAYAWNGKAICPSERRLRTCATVPT